MKDFLSTKMFWITVGKFMMNIENYKIIMKAENIVHLQVLM